MKWKYKKIIILILSTCILQSCGFTRSPEEHPLIVTGIKQSDKPGYNIYAIRDTDKRKEGWGKDAMYIHLKDKQGKFEIGDTIVFSKK